MQDLTGFPSLLSFSSGIPINTKTRKTWTTSVEGNHNFPEFSIRSGKQYPVNSILKVPDTGTAVQSGYDSRFFYRCSGYEVLRFPG